MMRKVLGLVTAATIMLGGSTGFAQSASSYEAPPPPRPLAGYDGGFLLRSADDDFSLQIMSQLQFQHLYQDIRATGATDTNTFRLRRARFLLAGKFFKNFESTLFVQHGTTARMTQSVSGCAGCTIGNPNSPFWWGDMTATVVPEFKITVGSITLPMDRSGEGSSGKASFIEQSIVGTQVDGQTNTTIARQAFTAGDTLGLRLWGTLANRFNYIVGFGNGEESNFFNTTRQFAYGSRFWVDILGTSSNDETDLAYTETPQFAIGVGAMYDPQNAIDSNINNVTLDWALTGSTDLYFKWRGLSIITEGYGRRLKVATGNFSLDDIGYLGQVGYFVIPQHLELAVRGAQMFREGPNNNAYEFGGALNWYLHGHSVKLQTEFTRLLDYDETIGTGGLATNRIRTMLTFRI